MVNNFLSFIRRKLKIQFFQKAQLKFKNTKRLK